MTDKTGTLTHGVFSIQKIANADGVTEEELLNALYAAECLSTHPIAKAICHDVDVKALAAQQVDYQEIIKLAEKISQIENPTREFYSKLIEKKRRGIIQETPQRL